MHFQSVSQSVNCSPIMEILININTKSGCPSRENVSGMAMGMSHSPCLWLREMCVPGNIAVVTVLMLQEGMVNSCFINLLMSCDDLLIMWPLHPHILDKLPAYFRISDLHHFRLSKKQHKSQHYGNKWSLLVLSQAVTQVVNAFKPPVDVYVCTQMHVHICIQRADFL